MTLSSVFVITRLEIKRLSTALDFTGNQSSLFFFLVILSFVWLQWLIFLSGFSQSCIECKVFKPWKSSCHNVHMNLVL